MIFMSTAGVGFYDRFLREYHLLTLTVVLLDNNVNV
jgi:5-formyltetrahydrofolate cyclo-ligase